MSGRNVIRGLFLIFIGIVLLLNNWGIIDWSFWLAYVYLWPVLLIVFGVKLLLPRTFWSDLLVVLLLVAIPFVYYFGIIPGWHFGRNLFPHLYSDKTEYFTWERPKQDQITRGMLILNYGIAELRVKPTQDRLLRAEFNSFARPDIEYRQNRGQAEISLKSRPQDFFFNLGRSKGEEIWQLSLQDDIPWTIQIDSGASNSNLDFSRIMVESLDIDTGASSLTVRMGDSLRETLVSISAGASELTLEVPQTAGIRLKTSTVLGNQDFPDLNLIKEGDYYVTPNLSQAKSLINIKVEAAVSSLRIQTYPPVGKGV